jgi:antitoxin (DNA-binding transcriptional repressor) of toxin-antitoxin stability system
MTATHVDMTSTTPTLPDLLEQLSDGDEIVLYRDGNPVARISPITLRSPRERIPNLHPGGWMSADFTDPLPDEFWLGDEK